MKLLRNAGLFALALAPIVTAWASPEALTTLRQSPSLSSLPPPLLDELSKKLGTSQQSERFARLAQSSGISSKLGLYDTRNPPQGLAEIASSLSSYGYSLAQAGNLSAARAAWEVTLTLAPRYVSTWIGMAILAVNEQDCASAVHWSNKVLAYKTDTSSSDPVEIASAQVMEGEGESETGTVGNTNAVTNQMHEIIDMCEGAH